MKGLLLRVKHKRTQDAPRRGASPVASKIAFEDLGEARYARRKEACAFCRFRRGAKRTAFLAYLGNAR